MMAWASHRADGNERTGEEFYVHRPLRSVEPRGAPTPFRPTLLLNLLWA